MILEVNSLPKMLDSMRIRIVNQSYPQKIFAPISHLIGGSESVKIFGVRGLMAV